MIRNAYQSFKCNIFPKFDLLKWPVKILDFLYLGMEIIKIRLCDKLGMVVSLFGKWEIEIEMKSFNHSKRELMSYYPGRILAPEW